MRAQVEMAICPVLAVLGDGWKLGSQRHEQAQGLAITLRTGRIPASIQIGAKPNQGYPPVNSEDRDSRVFARQLLEKVHGLAIVSDRGPWFLSVLHQSAPAAVGVGQIRA